MANILEASVNSANPPSADELKAMSDELDALTRARAPRIENRIGRGATSVSISNGQSATRFHGKGAASARTVLPAGMIDIPGAGRTTVAAAISAGLLPERWTSEKPSPFDPAPAAAGGSKVSPANHAAGPEDAPSDDAEGPEFAVNKAAVDQASRILSEVDAMIGQDVLDGMLQAAAEKGGLEPGQMPEGITEEMVAQVTAGYTAQANHTLAQIGTSTAGLEMMLTTDELRSARQAVVGGDSERLKELGGLANRRLAALPEADPDRFREMVDALPADQRNALRFDRNLGAWLIEHPAYGPMTFGSAVNLGIVRF